MRWTELPGSYNNHYYILISASDYFDPQKRRHIYILRSVRHFHGIEDYHLAQPLPPSPPPPLYIIIPTTELINTIGCFFALLSKLYYCTFYIQYSSTFSTSSSLTSSTSTTSSTSLKSLTSTFLYLFSLLLCHPLPLLLLLLLPLIQRLFRSSKADHTKP